MSLLDAASRRINQEATTNRIAENRRRQREEEYARSFAELDRQQAIVGSGMETMSYGRIQDLRAELQRMYDEDMGTPKPEDDHGKVIDGGPNSVVFRQAG